MMNTEIQCPHWTSTLDIVSIRFKCCDRYYPCITCHAENESHPPDRWTQEEFTTVKAIKCRKCFYVMNISDYLACNHQCPSCARKFNPNCSLHYHYYFESN